MNSRSLARGFCPKADEVDNAIRNNEMICFVMAFAVDGSVATDFI